ncbi:hypothetical protein THRCLA_21423 [Thraustotheca clavata]|uniref:Uncharacterized protein n=1 Tax=Thraustotheca clavata TaxID=74557 RepID=A0A1V9ZWN5_9STRA|nr:hypothetical protein THRCLA_21423 [Thraustotheca clavata]
MGANCCCYKREANDSNELKEKLLDKNERGTMDVLEETNAPLPSPLSISGSSYTLKNEKLLVSRQNNDEDDPFSSARDFVEERELSRSSSLRSYNSVSSLNGNTPKNMVKHDSYDDEYDHTQYNSQVFEEKKDRGWDI